MSAKLSALVDLAGGQVPGDLVYIVDLSAGVNGSKKSSLNDFIAQITKNITDGVLRGTNGSGTDAPGGNFDLSGGAGTGNALPGVVAVRYPLIGASGSTLQSLSVNRYPVVTDLFNQIDNSVAVTGTTTETTILGSVNGTKTLEAGITRIGQVASIKGHGVFNTSGASSLDLRLKVGSTTLVTINVGTLGNIAERRWDIEAQIMIRSVGATATWVGHLKFIFSNLAAPAITATTQGTNGNSQTIDATAAQAIDITAQWGTADASSIQSRYVSTLILR